MVQTYSNEIGQFCEWGLLLFLIIYRGSFRSITFAAIPPWMNESGTRNASCGSSWQLRSWGNSLCRKISIAVVGSSVFLVCPKWKMAWKICSKFMLSRHSGLVLQLNLNVYLANVSWAYVILFLILGAQMPWRQVFSLFCIGFNAINFLKQIISFTLLLF